MNQTIKQSRYAYQKVAPKDQRTSACGIVFDSKTELQRWEVLRLYERGGLIRNLSRQVKHELRLPDGSPIMAGKVCAYYTPDFEYEEKTDIVGGGFVWHPIIEDVKGYPDERSKFRIRVFEALNACRVRIVKKSKGNWIYD